MAQQPSQQTFTPPTEDELRQMAIEHLQRVAPKYASDQENIALRVRGTQRLARNLSASGLRLHEAWDQAIREELLSVPAD